MPQSPNTNPTDHLWQILSGDIRQVRESISHILEKQSEYVAAMVRNEASLQQRMIELERHKGEMTLDIREIKKKMDAVENLVQALETNRKSRSKAYWIIGSMLIAGAGYGLLDFVKWYLQQ